MIFHVNEKAILLLFPSDTQSKKRKTFDDGCKSGCSKTFQFYYYLNIFEIIIH